MERKAGPLPRACRVLLRFRFQQIQCLFPPEAVSAAAGLGLVRFVGADQNAHGREPFQALLVGGVGGLGPRSGRADSGGDPHAIRLAQNAQGKDVGDARSPLVDRVEGGRRDDDGVRGVLVRSVRNLDVRARSLQRERYAEFLHGGGRRSAFGAFGLVGLDAGFGRSMELSWSSCRGPPVSEGIRCSRAKGGDSVQLWPSWTHSRLVRTSVPLVPEP
jgi:hypothetical protein